MASLGFSLAVLLPPAQRQAPSERDGVSSPSSDRDSWTLCRFVDSLGYFGLSFQVGDFGLDIYLTQLVFGTVEVPARCFSIFMMQWLGRKWSQMLTLVLGGLVCISIVFVPAGAGAGSATFLPSPPRPRLQE